MDKSYSSWRAGAGVVACASRGPSAAGACTRACRRRIGLGQFRVLDGFKGKLRGHEAADGLPFAQSAPIQLD